MKKKKATVYLYALDQAELLFEGPSDWF